MIAIAIIGISVPKDKLSTKKKKKKFEHDWPDNYKVDPITGKKLWEEYNEPLPNLQEDPKWHKNFVEDDKLGLTAGDTYCWNLLGYKVISPWKSKKAFIGIGVLAVDCDSERLAFPQAFDSGKLQEEMKLRLEPLGLWDETTFGLWAIQG